MAHIPAIATNCCHNCSSVNNCTLSLRISNVSLKVASGLQNSKGKTDAVSDCEDTQQSKTKKKSANTPSDVQEFCSAPGPLEVKGDQQLDTEPIEVHKAVSVCTQIVPAATDEQLLITVPNPQKKKKRIKCIKYRRWNHTRAECPGTDASDQSAPAPRRLTSLCGTGSEINSQNIRNPSPAK